MLREDLQKVLDEYLPAKKENGKTSAPIAHYIKKDIPNHFNDILDSKKYHWGSSAGLGNLADVPRIDFGIKNIENEAKVDVAYLFKADMNGVYLVLRAFYYADLEKKYHKELPNYLKSKSIHIKELLEENNFKTDDFNEDEIDLTSKSQAAKQHSSGTIYSKYYESGKLPSEKELITDLKRFLELYEFILNNYVDKMFLTVDEWIEALENEELVSAKLLNVLEIMYNSKDYTACFNDVSKVREELGFPGESSYSIDMGTNSKRIKKYFNKTSLYNKNREEEHWCRMCYGKYMKNPEMKSGKAYYFTLREELIEALEKYEKSKRPDRIKIKMKYETQEKIDTSEEKSLNSFYAYLLDKGYYFDNKTIENYLLSLKVKPFVILTGNSGTGKTKLSQLFAQYLDQKDNYKIIPVGANWTENRHILGYFNIIKNEPQYTPAYDLIKHSQENEYPHFLILDEMNLSHVERYFADFLSAIESNENIPIHGKDELEIPENLFIIGTVNVDETTYMFSPKVLDRANTIEFKTYSAKDYMINKFNTSEPNGNIEYLEDILKDQEIQQMSIQELEKVFNNDEFWMELADEIFKFQEILKKAGFDFGFRVINEITRFMAVSYKYENEPKNWTNWKRYFDAQIKQKMLPKLHGSQKVIGETLDELLKACEDYPTSKAKLEEMIDVLNKQRYVSFIN
jgi:MoxR-like ATPase